MKSLKNQSGFTIVEFMIAIAVFTLVLLVCSFALVHVGRLYFKGVITNRTQDASRRLIEDVASAIQFGPRSEDPNQFVRSGAGAPPNTDHLAWCVGNIRYSYITTDSQGTNAGQTRHVLWKDRIFGGNCEPVNLDDAFAAGTGQDMLGNNMRIPEFVITRPAPGESLWQILIRVSYGDTADLFTDGANANGCIGSTAGGQFCAVTRFETSVVKRL